MRISVAYLGVLVTTALAACSTYEGDGKLADHGVFASHRRYIVDLGAADLTRPGRQEFRMAKLPGEEFTFGLQLRDTRWDQRTIHAKVRLALVNEKEETVFDVVETVSKWTWSASSRDENVVFVYVSGKSKEITLRPGVFTYELLGVGPDGGWGTYASIRKDGRYKLIFENLEPDPKATAPARVMAVGGGWK
jgi:hypothetical protein